MLKRQQLGIKEEAARAVLRDALQRGHGCVELRRDGKRPIFFCLLCETRCYNDVSLWNHLEGNLHARHLGKDGYSKKSGQERSQQSDSTTSLINVQKRIYGIKQQQQERHQQDSAKMQVDSVSGAMVMLPLVVMPELPLKLVDQGQIFVKVRPCSGAHFVEACWLEKRVLVKQEAACAVEYGIVVFPYSEDLGRGKIVRVSQDMMLVEQQQQQQQQQSQQQQQPQRKRGTRGRKRTKQTERICFICRQKMAVGKDVATLLNMRNKQMTCQSRNWLGAFHVYHTCCLISWILIFDAKFWTGQSLNFSRHYRKSLINAGQSLNKQDHPIFCPECQGTGFRFQGGQLEPPRYRLAQIFEWVLELVQARKVWIDHLGQEMTGLMFHASKGIRHPRDFESSLVLSRGMLRFFCTEQNSSMQLDSDGTANMDIDI